MIPEALTPPSKEIIDLVRSELGLNEKKIKEAVQHLKDWLELQPHLPKDYDEDRLERLLIKCKNNLEKTKRTLDMYYTVRTIAPELMTNWNTNTEWFQTISKLVYTLPLPELTPEGDRVTIVSIRDRHVTNFNSEYYYKMLLMGMQIRLKEDYNRSDIFLMDYSNFTLGHVCKFTFPSVKKLEVCIMEAFKCRMKAVLFFVLPSIAEFMLTWCKSIFKSKIMARFQLLHGDLDKLHKQVPKKILPEEYGGEAGKMDVLWGAWIKKLESYNQWFSEHEKLKSDESKRQGGKFNSENLFGFEGAFRKLELD